MKAKKGIVNDEISMIRVYNVPHTVYHDYPIVLSAKVKLLKKRISKTGFEIKKSRQSLFFQGKKLEDDQALSAYKLEYMSELELHDSSDKPADACG